MPHLPLQQKTETPGRVKKRRFNWVISDVVRNGLKFYLEWSARLRGQRFYCSALAGESEYNITVNCDLTVSCNCQDYNGSGHMGDLNKNSFKEIFFGPKAQHLRTELAKGKLPIMTCARCGDLKRACKSQVKVMKTIPGSSPIHNKNGNGDSGNGSAESHSDELPAQLFTNGTL